MHVLANCTSCLDIEVLPVRCLHVGVFTKSLNSTQISRYKISRHAVD